MGSLQAVIFDFDGVIADSEPLHLRAFQQTLALEGIALSAEAYYARYLGFDDVGLIEAVAKDMGRTMTADELTSLVRRKGAQMQALMHDGSTLFPGAADFIRASAAQVPVAVASGALRHEIVEILDAAGLAHHFPVIVAAGDTPESKPSPAVYRLAFDRLNQRVGGDLDAARCVAIEDSRWGLASAKGAGLRCVGVMTSYGPEGLPGAELVVAGLGDLTLAMLDELCDAIRPT